MSPSLCPEQYVPESARYNVSAGNVPAAEETLQKIAAMNRSALPAGRLREPVLVGSSWGSSEVLLGFLSCCPGLWTS